MSYIFGKLGHAAIIWPIRKSFQCILQGVRFLLANHTLLSGTSESQSYAWQFRNSLYKFGQTISVKWVSDHGEEQKLPDLPYSPKQLFWVSLYHQQSKASEELRASK